jgi:hypothetical protein
MHPERYGSRCRRKATAFLGAAAIVEEHSEGVIFEASLGVRQSWAKSSLMLPVMEISSPRRGVRSSLDKVYRSSDLAMVFRIEIDFDKFADFRTGQPEMGNAERQALN